MKLPRMLDIQQKFPRSAPLQIEQVIKRQFELWNCDTQLAGKRIAIGIGSRGISNIKIIAASVLEELRQRGASLFIVPAMGSHGGATSEGQAHILETYGITPANMGVPFATSMETVSLGATNDGVPVHFSAAALEADYLLPINRVKPHTDFFAPLGSGLMKMLAIGFGKQAGAAACHAAATRLGHERVIRQVARFILQSAPVLGGLAILENQFHETADLVLLTPDTLEEEEAKLLVRARSLMPKLPFDDIDLLIVDQIGKNVSGAGMDPNVVGRSVHGYSSSLSVRPNSGPRISRIFVRSVTEASSGNAVGIGMADFTTTSVVRSIDFQTSYMNALTALTPQTVKIPIHFDTDREAIERALQSLALDDPASAHVVQIRDTLSLEQVRISASYAKQLKDRDDLVAVSSEFDMSFDAKGNLISVDGFTQVGCRQSAGCTNRYRE
jgi:lactate racemase-like protein